MRILHFLTKTFVYFFFFGGGGGEGGGYNAILTRACNSRIVYMLYDDELYMLKSNKIYVMLCNVYAHGMHGLLYCTNKFM